jgi:hypothetical protein|tara:strand:+ start:350 stop:526 length:177 start_codon:yes stop_codon:yes gene_type:complete
MSREEVSSEDQKIIDEWLNAGNKITICPSGQTTEGIEPGGYASWGRKKKKVTPPKKKK